MGNMNFNSTSQEWELINTILPPTDKDSSSAITIGTAYNRTLNTAGSFLHRNIIIKETIESGNTIQTPTTNINTDSTVYVNIKSGDSDSSSSSYMYKRYFKAPSGIVYLWSGADGGIFRPGNSGYTLLGNRGPNTSNASNFVSAENGVPIRSVTSGTSFMATGNGAYVKSNDTDPFIAIGETYIKSDSNSYYTHKFIASGGTSSQSQYTYITSANEYSILRMYGGTEDAKNISYISSANKWNYFKAADTTYITSGSGGSIFRPGNNGVTYLGPMTASSSNYARFEAKENDVLIASNSTNNFKLYSTTYLTNANKTLNLTISGGTTTSTISGGTNISTISGGANTFTTSSGTNTFTVNGGTNIISATNNSYPVYLNNKVNIQSKDDLDDFLRATNTTWIVSGTNSGGTPGYHRFICRGADTSSGTWYTYIKSPAPAYSGGGHNTVAICGSDDVYKQILKDGEWQCVTSSGSLYTGGPVTPNNNSNNYAGKTVYGAYTSGDGNTYYGKIKVGSDSTYNFYISPSNTSSTPQTIYKDNTFNITVIAEKNNVQQSYGTGNDQWSYSLSSGASNYLSVSRSNNILTVTATNGSSSTYSITISFKEKDNNNTTVTQTFYINPRTKTFSINPSAPNQSNPYILTVGGSVAIQVTATIQGEQQNTLWNYSTNAGDRISCSKSNNILNVSGVYSTWNTVLSITFTFEGESIIFYFKVDSSSGGESGNDHTNNGNVFYFPGYTASYNGNYYDCYFTYDSNQQLILTNADNGYTEKTSMPGSTGFAFSSINKKLYSYSNTVNNISGYTFYIASSPTPGDNVQIFMYYTG